VQQLVDAHEKEKAAGARARADLEAAQVWGRCMARGCLSAGRQGISAYFGGGVLQSGSILVLGALGACRLPSFVRT
jgi:hypothetical protein